MPNTPVITPTFGTPVTFTRYGNPETTRGTVVDPTRVGRGEYGGSPQTPQTGYSLLRLDAGAPGMGWRGVSEGVESDFWWVLDAELTVAEPMTPEAVQAKIDTARALFAALDDLLAEAVA